MQNAAQFFLSRRSLLAAGAGLALTASASPAGAQDSSPEASPAAPANGIQTDGTWAYTDDRGVTITSPTVPERIIADINAAAALWDFGIRPVGVFGWNVVSETEFSGGSGGNVDMSTVEIVSAPGTDMLDIEKVISLAPDLIVSLVYAPEYGIWSINSDILSTVEDLAPIATISGIIRADEAVQSTANLAQALGIDLTATEIVTQKAAYDAAIEAFQATTAGKPDLSAIFVWASSDEFYVANPETALDVMLFRDFGLNVPELPVKAGEYWEVLGAEDAVKYPTDILFYSLRSEIIGIEGFQAHPTFSLHPAVKAGQVYPWNQDVITNYPGMTTILTNTAASLTSSDSSVGEI